MLSDQYFSVRADVNYPKTFLARKQNISATLLNFISTEIYRDIRLNFPLSYQESLININNSKNSGSGTDKICYQMLKHMPKSS